MRERNVLLVAGGYAPVYPERGLEAPELQGASEVIDLVLRGHLPYPAFAIDRRWNILSSNRSLPKIYEGVAAELLAPPVNALRLTLHPDGMARKILNLEEWRGHVLSRLRAQIAATADEALADLYAELRSFGDAPTPAAGEGRPLIPFQADDRSRPDELRHHHHDLRQSARRHPLGADDRMLLPGRRRDPRTGPADERGCVICFSLPAGKGISDVGPSPPLAPERRRGRRGRSLKPPAGPASRPSAAAPPPRAPRPRRRSHATRDGPIAREEVRRRDRP